MNNENENVNVEFAPCVPTVEWDIMKAIGSCPFGGDLEVHADYRGFDNSGKVTVQLHSTVTGFLSGASKDVFCSTQDEFTQAAAELTVTATRKMQANIEACME